MEKKEEICKEKDLIKFKEDGYLIIPDFLTKEETQSLKQACHKLVDEFNHEDQVKTIFSTTNHENTRSDYFLGSGDKIRFFFEQGVMDDCGNLLVEKHNSLNKIGHALHFLVPEFKTVSFSSKIKSLSKQLGFKSPAIVQSMYIFKGPHYGGEVTPHKDCTFLSTDPQSCIGFWLALEDATLDNGCLWFHPGSHRTPTQRRMIRSQEKGCATRFIGKEDEDFPEKYVPAPVAEGTLVLIDGQVTHKSNKNTSDQSRHIYTFHVIERENTTWDPQNWLQPTPEMPFTGIYEN